MRDTEKVLLIGKHGKYTAHRVVERLGGTKEFQLRHPAEETESFRTFQHFAQRWIEICTKGR